MEVLDAERIHLINVDVSVSLRQISFLCLLLGPAVFQRKPGDPGCPGPRPLPGFDLPDLLEAHDLLLTASILLLQLHNLRK